jgi:hypothetical protein
MSEDLKYAAEEFSRVLKEILIPKHFADPKIIEFISKYIQYNNITKAAKAVGLSTQDGKWLFNQVDIYKAITSLQTKDVERFGYQAAEVVERTKEIANLDPADLFNDDGTIIENMKQIPEHARRAIKRFKAKNIFENDHNGMPQYVGKMVEVEFWDKLKGNELLAREKDVFKKTDVIQHDVSKNAREYLLGSLSRAGQVKAQLNAPVERDAEVIDVTPKPKFTFTKPKGVV